MGEIGVYYVPRNQEDCVGRGKELEERLWDLGAPLSSDRLEKRVRKFEKAGKPIPDCGLNIPFSDMGLVDVPDHHPVPNHLYDLRCPFCAKDPGEVPIWGDEDETDMPLLDRPVHCDQCGSDFPVKNIKSGDAMTFARFYIFVSDCEREGWDPRFQSLLESVLGPCEEYWEWST